MVIFGNDYKIVWYTTFKKDIVGHVNNYTLNFYGERRIYIKLDDIHLNKTNHRFLALFYFGKEPVIVVSNDFMKLNISLKNGMIWHETGHVHYEHFTNVKDNSKSREYRASFLKNDLIAPEEMDADIFAVSKFGKHKMLKVFKFLIQSRIKYESTIKLNQRSPTALKELELRNKEINKYKNMYQYYFAYGSNLNRSQMFQRCPDHKYIGNGHIKGYLWFINSRGYANIKISENDYILGAIYKISESDEYELDLKEGVFERCYEKFYLDVNFNNDVISCLVYIDPINEMGKPKQEYIDKLLAGFKEANLPIEYYNKYLKSFLI